MRALKGMLVRLELRKTLKDSNYHTTLCRIDVDGNRAVARCVVCGCHRLTLTPELDFLLTVIATLPGTKDKIIIIKDGTYEPQDFATSTNPVADYSDLRPEGRGKTTLGAKTDRPLFFALERGMPAGVVVDAVQDIGCFGGIMNALQLIYNEGPGDYGTLVFDTLDEVEAHLIEHVCTAHGWKNIEQPSYGKGYVAADDEWRRFLRAITAIRDKHGMTIVLLCHSTVEVVNDPRAPSYTAYAPKLHKRARALVMDACDIVGFFSEDLRIVTDDGGFRERTRAAAADGRQLFVEGKPAFAAKNRFGMPPKISIPLNLDFGTLSKYWR